MAQGQNGQLSTVGWAMGVVVLGTIGLAGVLVGYAIGASRPDPKIAEVAELKPNQKVTPPVAEPKSKEQPKKETPQPKKETPPPKKETPKKEPPKKEEPKVEPKKPDEPPTVPVVSVSFTKEIFPIFQDKCFECHQPGLKKGGLDLKTLASIEKGGTGGKALVPGKLEESLIWTSINAGEMPPAGKKPLTEAEKKLIMSWIASGGKDEPKKPTEPLTPPPTTVPVVTFAKEILPIFQNKCFECHQPGLKKGGLDLKTLASITKGGNGGKALSPGKLEDSLIWTSISNGDMPPAGKKELTEAEKKLIMNWIASGGK